MTRTSVQSRFLDADAILGFLAAHVDTLCGFGVKRLGLFGSFVRGEQDQDSDLDFLVEFASRDLKTFDNYFNLKFRLEDTLGYGSDLVIAENLREQFRPQILSDVRYVEGL
ncbi:MAG: nucleotidyltransferase family protein [Chloroflexi bacterium]|nr:nucleotidyltransferase family protein [Chloroflexota bacterium]